MDVIDYDDVAELYDAYVSTEYDGPFFTEEVRRTTGPVLELTSGTGRLSVPLVEAGADLTCVDASASMLAVLARKLAVRELKAEIVCEDVCQLAFPPQFGLAILPFQSLMEVAGEVRQRAMLAAAYAALHPGGRFICTSHNPVIRRRVVDGILRVVGRFPHAGGSLVVSGFETGGIPMVSRLQFFEFYTPDGRLVWKRLMPMEFEMVERERFEPLATAAGFRISALFGDYSRIPFDPATSPVMIWVLDKPA